EVFLPRASELNARADSDVLRTLVCKGMGVAFVLSTGLFIGGWYFSGHVIELWIGEGYDTSQLVFLLLIAAQIAAAPAGILHMVLVGIGEVRVPSLLLLAQAVLNLVLSLIFVQPLGIVGVALGTMIPILLVDVCVLLPYGIRRFQLAPGEFARRTILPYVLPLAALWAYSSCVSQRLTTATWPIIIAVTVGGGIVLLLTSAGVWYLTERRPVHSLAFAGRSSRKELAESV
ncbi:MAG: polysaccharide biosynthesis protein, partial [Planctomycetaceae bacterium]|nr:polysaccharide biosynthesis protein [Planctomycetaceae bacterium]